MGVLFSLVTALLFSLGNVYNRKTSLKFTGLEAIALNVTLMAVFFFPLSLLVKAIQGTSWPDLMTILMFALVGIIHSFLARWGLFNAIRYIGPSRASVIKNSAPAFTIILAFLFMQQLPTILSFVGIVIILMSIWMLGWQEQQSKMDNLEEIDKRKSQKGLALGLLVAFLFASADILRAISMERFSDAFLATGISTLAAWITVMLFLLKEKRLAETYKKHVKSMDKNLVVATLYWGLAIITNFIAVQYLFVAYVTSLIATAPIMTAFLSFLISRGDEKFSHAFWMSTILMITGGVIVVLFQ